MNRNAIEAAVKQKGYVWFNGLKDYDLNIVGVRNNNNNINNLFDDWLTLSFRMNGIWQYYEWNITTDPGKYYSKEKLLDTDGVARLVEGQYRGCYKIGLHQGKYKALTQSKPVKVYRDKNINDVFDGTKIEEGLFGINIHRASMNGTTKFVDKWSAGCQVFQNINDFNTFMRIVNKAADIWGNNFTYTLINKNDIK